MQTRGPWAHRRNRRALQCQLDDSFGTQALKPKPAQCTVVTGQLSLSNQGRTTLVDLLNNLIADEQEVLHVCCGFFPRSARIIQASKRAEVEAGSAARNQFRVVLPAGDLFVQFR